MGTTTGPVAVTGADGLLGIELMTTPTAVEIVGLGRSDLDITDAAAVTETMRQVRPSVIVNCAAYTAVDDCEAYSRQAHAVNESGVANLREVSSDLGAHLVQMSTDYVFSGDKLTAYIETDQPNPLSVYGASKLAGEIAAGLDATIVRTSSMCGFHRPNIVTTILKLAETHQRLTFVDDQRSHPSFTSDIAPVILRLALERRAGAFHITNQRAVSWYEFAREVLAAAGDDPDRVSPISSSDMKPSMAAVRPKNSVLDNKALRDAGWPETRDFGEPLAELVHRLKSNWI